MNFEQYFRDRGELVRSVLGEAGDDRPIVVGWRSFAAGASSIAFAIALQLWASGAQADPGYFARTTNFLLAVAIGGLWLLTMALLADYRLTRFAVSTRAALKEKTLHQMLHIDGLLARRLTASPQSSPRD